MVSLTEQIELRRYHYSPSYQAQINFTLLTAAFIIAFYYTDASAGSFTGLRSICSLTASVTTRFASASVIESASNALFI